MKKFQNKKKMGNKGFSLVELVVVIAIMAILIGVLAPTLLNNIEKARYSKDKQAFDTINTAIQQVTADEEAYKEFKDAFAGGNNVAISTFFDSDDYTNVERVIKSVCDVPGIVSDLSSAAYGEVEIGDIMVYWTTNATAVFVASENDDYADYSSNAALTDPPTQAPGNGG